MAHAYWNELRAKVAKRLGIDPDRIVITAGREMYHYIASVQGPIPRADEQTLRDYLNGNTPAHILWTVKAETS